MYKIPEKLEKTLLSYIKKTYLPKGHANPKTADQFTNYDVKFFARGAAELSQCFTSERAYLPKNYLNKKELRAGYILYFVMANFLKMRFCLEAAGALERFAGSSTIKIADIGCGPGTASLACADYWRGQTIEITAIDQNTGILHDAKHIFREFAEDNAKLKTVYSNLHPKNIRHVLKEKFNIIIAANFLSEIGDTQKQAELVSALLANHLETDGLLIIIEPALRWTTRNLMKLRDVLLSTINHQPSTILSPCLHNLPCPMLATNHRDWCHMYLNWKRPDVIEKIDRLIGNRKDYLKFSYLIFELSHYRTIEPSHPIWRVVSAPMHSKGKIELLLCNASGLKKITRLDKDASDKNKDFEHVWRGDLVTYAGTNFQKVF